MVALRVTSQPSPARVYFLLLVDGHHERVAEAGKGNVRRKPRRKPPHRQVPSTSERR